MIQTILSYLYAVTAFFFPGHQEEHLAFTMPKDQIWHAEYQNLEEDAMTQTFTPDGQSLQNWKEMLTVQIHFSAASNFDELAETLRANLEGQHQGKHFEYRFLETSPDSIFFEWWTKQQHGWCRGIKGNVSSYFLSYTTKNLRNVEQAQKTWAPILEDAYLTDDPSALGEEVEAEALNSGLKEFRDQNNTFSIGIPNGWEIVIFQNDRTKAMLHSFTSPQKTASITISSIPSKVSDIDQLLRNWVSSATADSSGAKFIKYDFARLSNGQQVKGAIFGPTRVGDYGEMLVNHFHVFIPHENGVIMLMTSARVDLWDEMFPLIKKILSTFQLQ